jgi:hypothetical protein
MFLNKTDNILEVSPRPNCHYAKLDLKLNRN